MSNNVEYKKESSLTAPEDRDLSNKWKPDQSSITLSENEVNLALEQLNNNDFTKKFPAVDRVYADPVPPMQNIGLISFVPAKGSTPNENGIYGFAKLRGNYVSMDEANTRAEFIIRNVDSYHQIYHTYVGRPFPLTKSSKWSAETNEIDIRKQTTESMSNDIKEIKKDDEKKMKEIKENQEKLLEDTQKESEDPYDNYITLNVKKAQLSWTYLQHVEKMKEIKEIILSSRNSILKLDEEYPEFKDIYLEKYMNARKEVGFKDSEEDLKTSFLSFLVKDIDLPGIDNDLHFYSIKDDNPVEESKDDNPV